MSLVRIFISHSSQDNEWCRPFAAALKAVGYDVWYDEIGLAGGAEWVATLQDQVESCDVFLVVLTPAAGGSHWVQQEIHLALASQRAIVPVLLKPTDVQGFLRARQYVVVEGFQPEVAARRVIVAIETAQTQVQPAVPTPSAESLDDLITLCRTLWRDGRKTEALSACDRALALDAECLPILEVNANILYEVGSWDKAVVAGTTWLVRDPASSRAQSLVKYAVEHCPPDSKWAGALETLDAAIATSPTSVPLLSAKARLLLHCGAPEAAAMPAVQWAMLDFKNYDARSTVQLVADRSRAARDAVMQALDGVLRQNSKLAPARHLKFEMLYEAKEWTAVGNTVAEWALADPGSLENASSVIVPLRDIVSSPHTSPTVKATVVSAIRSIFQPYMEREHLEAAVCESVAHRFLDVGDAEGAATAAARWVIQDRTNERALNTLFTMVANGGALGGPAALRAFEKVGANVENSSCAAAGQVIVYFCMQEWAKVVAAFERGSAAAARTSPTRVSPSPLTQRYITDLVTQARRMSGRSI